MAELQFLEHFDHLRQIGMIQLVILLIKGDRHIQHDGGQFLGKKPYVLVGLDPFLHLPFQLIGILQQPFQAAEFLDELLGGLLTYSGKAGNIIRTIAHHPQEIDHLLRAFYLELVLHFLDPPGLIASTKTGFVHEDVLRDQLGEVLVRGHHIGGISLFFGLLGQCSYDIVGFVTLLYHYRDVHGFQYALDIWHCYANGFRSLVPIGLVFREFLCTAGTPSTIEAHGQMVRPFSFDHIKQRIRESEDGRGIHSLGVYSRVLNKGVVAPKDQGISIQKKESFGFGHNVVGIIV